MSADQLQLRDVLRGTCLGTFKQGRGRRGLDTIAFAKDGQQIILSDQESVRVWDPARVTPQDCGLISSVTLVPTCSKLICALDDNTLQIWDAASGTLVCDPLQGHGDRITSTAFSDDGTRIASASGDGKILLWDAVQGQIIGTPLEGHTATVTSVAFSPTGDQVVSASKDNTIRIWDATTYTSAKAPLTIHVAYVESVAFSPDGTRIICVHLNNSIVQILDPSLCATTNILNHSIQWMPPRWCTFLHGDEQIVFISQDGRHHVRDTATGLTTGVSAAENVHHIYARISSDAKQFVFTSQNSDIRISDVATGAVIGPPLKHTGTIQSIAISPDSERIASLSDSARIRVWDTTNGTLIASVIEGKHFDPKLIAFSLDGKQIVRADNEGNIHVWDYTTGLVISHESYPPTESEPLASVSFSSDGTQIICVLEDNRIRTWNYLSNSVVDENMPQDVYSSFAAATRDMSGFSDVHFPDGRRIASISQSQMIGITNTATGDLKHLLFDGIDVTIELPTFSPDGMMVGCVIVPDTIHIWNPQTGIAIGKPVKVPASEIMSIKFSLDGTKLAYTYISGSAEEVTLSIRVWDIAGAVSVRELQRPMVSVRSFFCFPDCARIIVTHPQDGEMEIWMSLRAQWLRASKVVLVPLIQ